MNIISRSIALVCTGLLPLLSQADSLPLTPAWSSQALLEQPESVVLDSQHNALLVSNVNGQPNEANGKGYIASLDLDGNIIKQHWLDGFNAPKGLAIVGNTLYVADINELVVVDITKQKISQRYTAKDAKFLNDVAADTEGNIFVSDMLTNTIYKLTDNAFEPWLSSPDLDMPNGLLIDGDQLIVGSWGNMTSGFNTEIPGHLKTISLSDKTIASLGNKKPVGNLDGVEPDGKGNYYVTDWMAGKLLRIKPSGESKLLIALDAGSADLTVLAEQNLVIIPMMMSGKLLAFRINE